MADGIKIESLYNKYRPRTFDDIVGQRVPISVMKNAITTGKVANAYLLSGQRGVGKTSAARIFAKALLCNTDDRTQPDGCGECDSCQSFDEENAADFIEIDAASNRGIDNIRSLIQNVGIAPRISHKRVVLIDEVHHLTSDASTALLKVLEEPPSNTVFLLATTEPQKILPTIRSRCQWLRFQPLSSNQISMRIAQILHHEGIEAEESVAALIARQSKGGLRDALSMLDMLIAYSGGNLIKLSEAERCLGAVNRKLLSALCSGFIENALADMMGFTVKNPSDSAPKDIMLGFADIVSDALIIQHCGEDALGVLDVSNKEMAQRMAKNLDTARLIYIADTIERHIWKFDSDALDDGHVFNEIILMCFDRRLNPAFNAEDKSAEISDDVAYIKNKIDTLARATGTLINIQKKSMGKD